MKQHPRSGVQRRLVVGERAEHARTTGTPAMVLRGRGDPRGNVGVMDVRLLLVAQLMRPASDQGIAIVGKAVRFSHCTLARPPERN